MSSQSIPHQLHEIKRHLARSYFAFFKGFGNATRMQIEAMAALVAGKDVIIHSPAASGKTEAALAPLLEKILRLDTPGLKLIYVVPTRTLANDIMKRVRGPIREAGATVAIKTGDHPQFQPRTPADVLVTTPESLDSLAARHEEVMATLRAIIIDEIHLIDNTYRGDQLRVIIRRIGGRANQRVQFCALSATLGDPAETAARYFSDPYVVTGQTTRHVIFQLVSNLVEAIAYCRNENLLKVLIFANSRQDVESAAQHLGTFYPKDHIVVHHGSLGKKTREEAERCMHEWRWGICIATTTLEIGIDIGDVDVVIFLDPPPDPSSFHQRAGRGSRRSDRLILIGITQSEEETATYNDYKMLLREGKVEVTDYEVDRSVCVQQLFSIAWGQPRGIAFDILNDLLGPIFTTEVVSRICAHLESTGYLAYRHNKWFPTTKLIDLGRMIHSNIPNESEYTLVDAHTGRVLGKLAVSPSLGACIVFQGRPWVVNGVDARRIFLVSARRGTPQKFRRRAIGGAFQRFLPDEYRRKMKNGLD